MGLQLYSCACPAAIAHGPGRGCLWCIFMHMFVEEVHSEETSMWGGDVRHELSSIAPGSGSLVLYGNNVGS